LTLTDGFDATSSIVLLKKEHFTLSRGMNINEQSGIWKQSPAKSAKVGYKVVPVFQQTWIVSNGAKTLSYGFSSRPALIEGIVSSSSSGSIAAFSRQNFALSNIFE
jgi:hypothetical protein